MSLDFMRAADEAAALAAGSGQGALFIAGGTSVVDLMRLGVENPARLVDITGLGWSKIERTPEGLRIGALVRNTALAYAPDVMRDYPALSEALLAGASPQLRNMASVGGNVLQRTRCSYYRDPATAACNKRKPGSGCAAISGYARMHAILGGSAHCIAVNPSDMCVALAALDAVVHTRGAHGERTIAFSDFHTLPGAHPELESVLEHGELITHLSLPANAFARRSAYVKVRDRASFAFALTSAAAALEITGGKVSAARVALGGVATKPWRSRQVEGALLGKTPTRESFASAAAEAVREAHALPDNRFKVELIQSTIVRALERARDRA
jgi:xanthine dehydrogenase YagS FAD-binding subunit